MPYFPALLLIVALFPCGENILDGYRGEVGPFGILYYRGWDPSGRRDAMAYVGRQIRWVEHRLNRDLGKPITVVLAPNRKEFSRLVTAVTGRAPQDWVQGLAIPARDWIFVREDLLPTSFLDGDPTTTTLLHEITHLVIHGKGNVRLPRWLDEGVAMWVSGDVIPPDDEAFLSGLARIGGLFPIQELEEKFPTSHKLGTLAYQQSLLLVRFLVECHGEPFLMEILDRLESGEPYPDSYRVLTGESWAGVERKFRDWVGSRYSLFEVFFSVVNLWTAIALLALVAIGVSVVRTRRLWKKMREEDRLQMLGRLGEGVVVDGEGKTEGGFE